MGLGMPVRYGRCRDHRLILATGVDTGWVVKQASRILPGFRWSRYYLGVTQILLLYAHSGFVSLGHQGEGRARD